MKRTFLLITSISALVLVCSFHVTHAAPVKLADAEILETLARQATSNDPAKSADAIAQLRAS